MTTPYERVEVTPELLAREAAHAARTKGPVCHVQPAVVLALVGRIRELEADLAEVYADERLHQP
jgi:hypothetical protein